MIQKTLIILKPDCVKKNLIGEVLDRFQKKSLSVVGAKMIFLTDAIIEKHYAHMLDSIYYPGLKEFMQSGPVLVVVLQGEDCIKVARAMLGSTDSTKAEKGTIRGDYGTSTTVNVVHASDSPESAEKEIYLFFTPAEIF